MGCAVSKNQKKPNLADLQPKRQVVGSTPPAPPPQFWNAEHQRTICEYCGELGTLVSHEQSGYPYRGDYGPMWVCLGGCDAYCGCHPGTDIALGRMANRTLRSAKKEAHAAFDPMWQRKVELGSKRRNARSDGYTWLAGQLGVKASAMHIGWLDLEQCRAVVAACNPKNWSNAA